eukprot:7132371-Pyramimonas_sp.AAC.1
MIGNPAVVVGVEYNITFSVGNLLACCQANTTIHNVEYVVFFVKHEIRFAFIEPIYRMAHR